MSFARNFRHAQSAMPKNWRRWMVLGLLSLLLHVMALHWINGNFALLGRSRDEAPTVLQTTLVPLPAPVAAPVPRPTVRPVAARAPKPRPTPPKASAAPPAPSAPASSANSPVTNQAVPMLTAAASDTVMASAPSWPSAQEVGNASAIPDLAALDTDAGKTTGPITEKTLYKIDPPPSATLEYAVQAMREGQMMHGHGKIDWKFSGSQYMIQGQAGILFISLLDFGSQGHIDEFGIAPLQYTEKRFRRAPTETRFNRESKLISFSASPKSFPLQGGEQDRASIIWQLASIGRGDAARFTPGAQIPIFIAGVRDGSAWNIQVIGEEEINVGVGGLRAWHVRRAPRTGDKDQVLDIWLAPSHHWYPVKLRYTEANGEYLELSLSAIQAPAS